jgi:hypothetical protein
MDRSRDGDGCHADNSVTMALDTSLEERRPEYRRAFVD